MESDPSIKIPMTQYWYLQNERKDCILGVCLLNNSDIVQIFNLASATQPHRINAFVNTDGISVRVDQVLGSHSLKEARRIWVNLVNAGWIAHNGTSTIKQGVHE